MQMGTQAAGFPISSLHGVACCFTSFPAALSGTLTYLHYPYSTSFFLLCPPQAEVQIPTCWFWILISWSAKLLAVGWPVELRQ